MRSRRSGSSKASTVKSVTLTAIGSAADLPQDPAASAAVTITAPAELAPDPTITTITTPLAVSSLPDIPAASPTLSPGGNAAALFPALRPSPTASQAAKESTRPVADTSALPEGSPVVGAQLVGLAALALAFILAVTRLSIRRRPVHAQAPADPSAKSPDKSPDED
jgi:hypothetical protein